LTDAQFMSGLDVLPSARTDPSTLIGGGMAMPVPAAPVRPPSTRPAPPVPPLPAEPGDPWGGIPLNPHPPPAAARAAIAKNVCVDRPIGNLPNLLSGGGEIC
jgi:hypothetical protein